MHPTFLDQCRSIAALLVLLCCPAGAARGELSVWGVSPCAGPQAQVVAVQIHGEGFVQPLQTRLQRAGDDPIPGQSISLVAGVLWCRFEIGPQAATGAWDLVVVNGDSAEVVRPEDFEVTTYRPWTAEERLSFDLAPSIQPAIAGTPDGGVHVVWSADDGTPDIYYRESFSDAWAPPERLTFGGGAQTPFILAGGLDNALHLVWEDIRDGNSEVYYKRREGGQWGPDVRMTEDPYPSADPFVVCGPDSLVHLVWRDFRLGYSQAYYRTWDGQSWSEEIRLSDSAVTIVRPRLVVLPDGQVHAFWVSWPQAVPHIYHRYFTGAEWTEVEQITEDDAWIGEYSVARGAGGRIHLAFGSARSGEADDIYASSWDGAFWEPAQAVAATSGVSAHPRVAVDSHDVVHITFEDDPCLDDVRQVSHVEGRDGRWSQVQTVSGGRHPAVICDGLDRTWLAWHDYRDGNAEIYVRRVELPITAVPGEDSPPEGGGLAVAVPGGPDRVAATPNPFREGTEFSLPAGGSGPWRLSILAPDGRRIRVIETDARAAAPGRIGWDGRGNDGRTVPAGAYYFVLESRHHRQAGRLTRLR